MTSILLCGEGSTDCGVPQYGTKLWQDGPVQAILKKVISAEISTVQKKDALDVRLSRSSKEAKIKGHGVKAYKLCTIASEEKLKNIICYVDADKDHKTGNSEVQAEKRFKSIYDEIATGFIEFNRLNPSSQVSGIPMIPIRMIESWLLGDEKAYEKAFGTLPSNPKVPSKPELVWGDKDNPDSNFPKCILTKVLKQYRETCSRETFNLIAHKIDIETLIQRCPISFKRFIEDVEKLNK